MFQNLNLFIHIEFIASLWQDLLNFLRNPENVVSKIKVVEQSTFIQSNNIGICQQHKFKKVPRLVLRCGLFCLYFLFIYMFFC